MSRLYEMSVEIRDFDPKRRRAIKKSACKEWKFDAKGFDTFDGTLTAYAQGSLGGGESEEEFAERLAKAVFKANGKPCEVTVKATYMEELPYETYLFDAANPPG